MKQTVKHLLFILLMLLLLLPFVQQQWNIIQMEPLKGAIETPVQPAFSAKNFYGSSYQDSLNTFVEQHIGFRPFLVRMHNQLNYTAFDIIAAKGVIKGKDGFLFEQKYLHALYGSDYIGDEKLMEDIRKTHEIAEWLGQQNKHLMVVLAPGKGSFFSEYAPKTLASNNPGKRNSEEYYKLLRQNQVPVIDGNSWFLAMKDTTTFPLFPKLGIHWSYYGMGLVFDSIIKTMEQALGYRFIDFQMQDIEVSHELRSPDRDLWEGVNIFAKPDDFPMPYPSFVFKDVQGVTKPSVIVVADSYYWQWFGGGHARRAFGETTFWYYNKLIFPADGSEPANRESVNLLEEIAATDFIILLQTDANMDRYSFGIVDDLHHAIIYQSTDYESDRIVAVRKIMAGIRANKTYMESIAEKALSRGISTEEMLRLDANWIYEQRQKQ
jgi:hypothetical protein